MLTVRFPSGVSVQYNSANYLSYKNEAWELYESKGGRWVCSIATSSGVIIEAKPACSVTAAPLSSPNEAMDRIVELAREQQLGTLRCEQLKILKRALARFDMRTGAWT